MNNISQFKLYFLIKFSPHQKTRVGVLANVPDSITSWRLTAFAIHDVKGLGITSLPGHVIKKAAKIHEKNYLFKYRIFLNFTIFHLFEFN
jgi:hypothetical protein